MMEHVRGARPAFHDQPAIDRLVAMVLALTGEVSVLRDRLDTVEALGQAAGWLGASAVDGYVPDLARRTVREARREAMLARIFAVMQQEIAALEGGDPDYWATISDIEEGRL